MSDDGSSDTKPVELTTKGRIMDGECVRVRLQQKCVFAFVVHARVHEGTRFLLLADIYTQSVFDTSHFTSEFSPIITEYANE